MGPDCSQSGPWSDLPARFAALTTAATAAKAAAATATTTAVAARRHRPRLIHGEVAPAVLVPIELADRALGTVGVAHLDKREPPCLTGRPNPHDVDARHRADRLEQSL